MTRRPQGGALTAIVVERQPVMRRALEEALQSGGFDVSGTGPTLGAVHDALYDRPSALLVGWSNGGAGDISSVRAAIKAAPESKVIVIAPLAAEASAPAAFAAGASAFIYKSVDPADLAALVRQIVFENLVCAPSRAVPSSPADGLTPRERQVLSQVAEGSSNAAIAAELHLSEATVKFHLRNVYRKLGVQGRTDAVRVAQQIRLLPWA